MDKQSHHQSERGQHCGQLVDLGLGHRYRLDCLLASSTCGDIWRATWMQTGGRVTLKTLQSGLPQHECATFSEILSAEAEHLRCLNHPHIVRFQRTGYWQGSPVLVMEQLDLSLSEWLKQRVGQHGISVVPQAQAMLWAGQLARALVALHRSGRKHLDLKPANVLLTRPDARGIRSTRLADFGACLPLGRMHHRLVGTLGWAAPEQLHPVGMDVQGYALYATSVASDWFALGQLLHRMLYGRLDSFGEQTLLRGEQQATAGIQPVHTPVLMVDDSPTWLGSDPPVEGGLAHPSAHQPAHLHFSFAHHTRDAVTSVQGTVHQLVMQLLSHNPEERLLAAARWF